ncbi:MAG: GxxExxY protein, partial [Kiritimatiellae bacterium]|nr:GxxExxY protein [Kiritimatiellia bacterium]
MNAEKLCYKVIGAAMAVHRHFGSGYLEEVYKNALMVEPGELGLRAEKEVPIPVDYKGVRVGEYRADIIVEKSLLLELKAVSALNAVHEAQLVNYLNATKIEDGFLINFGAASLERKHKFRTYRPKPKSFSTHDLRDSQDSRGSGKPENPVHDVSRKAEGPESFQTHDLQDSQDSIGS